MLTANMFAITEGDEALGKTQSETLFTILRTSLGLAVVFFTAYIGTQLPPETMLFLYMNFMGILLGISVFVCVAAFIAGIGFAIAFVASLFMNDFELLRNTFFALIALFYIMAGAVKVAHTTEGIMERGKGSLVEKVQKIPEALPFSRKP